MPYFYVDGMHLENSGDAHILVNKIMLRHKVLFVQLVSIETNPWNLLFTSWRKAHLSGWNFFDLTDRSFQNFNMMYGMIDTF